MENLAIITLCGFARRGAKVEEAIQAIRKTKTKYIHDITQTRFSNGEAKIMLNESVRGKDVYIIADVCNYNCTYQMFGATNRMSPDDHFQDIKRAVSAASWRAKRITVIMPYLYAGRQHRRMSRESLDCAVALQELENLGIDRIITFDAHDPNIVNAIPLSSFENMTPIPNLLEAYLRDQKGRVDANNTIIVSPDYGSMSRAIKVASVMGVDAGVVYKRRDYSTVVKGRNPTIGFSYSGPDVAGKSVIIVDDMIASGGSILEVAKHLKQQGVGDVTVLTSFALFNDGTDEFDNLYEDGIIKRVYSTNLSYVSDQIKQKKWFVQVDLTQDIAAIIDALNNDKTVARFIDNFSTVKELLQQSGK